MANIRPARRSGRILRGGRMVRESLWFFWAPVNANMGAASTAILTNSLNAAALALTPFTVVRVRGSMLLGSDQETTSEFYQAALGFAVVSIQASAIGVTAVPTPFTDAGSDKWFVYESIVGQVRVSSAIGIWEAGVRREFDSRAMRKVEDQEDIVSVVETSSISLGANLAMSARVLIKLH